MRILARKGFCEWLRAALILAAILLAEMTGTALAHKGKLPPDALSLVRQAAALLAQDPKMLAEARERLEAALASEDARGVDLLKVREARDALAAGDMPAARRALTDAVIAGAPMSAPPSGSAAPPPAAASPADTMAAMRMAEPLVTRFGGSPGELATLLLGLALVGVGVRALRRGR